MEKYYANKVKVEMEKYKELKARKNDPNVIKGATYVDFEFDYEEDD